MKNHGRRTLRAVVAALGLAWCVAPAAIAGGDVSRSTTQAQSAESAKGAAKATAQKTQSASGVRKGQKHRGTASWYGRKLDGRKTASGETFDDDKMTAAHRTLPLGTRVRVTDEDSGNAVVVRINDRGPYAAGRTIDLSRRAGETLGITDEGVADVTIEVVAPPPKESAERARALK